MLESLAEFVGGAGPLLTLALVIVVGVAFGSLSRVIGLPAVTGQIVGGALFGRAGLDLLEDHALEDLRPLTNFALGLIAVTVGAHLNVRRLRNAGKRLFLLLITESIIVPTCVFLVLWGAGGTTLQMAALLAAVAIATAPAAIVSIVKETRSKGVFVKTLIAAVALNNMACIVTFEVVRATVKSWEPGGLSLLESLAAPAIELATAIGIGGGVALAMEGIARIGAGAERLTTAAVVALMLATGLATTLGVSPLLTCLFLGLVQTNLTRNRTHLVDSVFAEFEPAILAVFFTLAGMHLSLEHIGLAGVVAALYFFSRGLGKIVAASLAMRLAQATARVRRNLGIALIPQAGVAVGLVLVTQEDPYFSDIAGFFSAVVLSVVTLNEIVGPVLTRSALRRAGEIGKDRLRLIDFLQEENIVTDFHADTKDVAIERLVDLMITSHHLDGLDRASLLESVLEREAEASTCLGGGLAVPHGILPKNHPMVGVMAISREGLHFETPDQREIHCMVLLGTSPEERERHLQVLATLARTVGIDPAFQDELFNAKSAAHACEILHGEESEDFNYFLEEES